ncbi:Wzy polymerase domain-containing protein [Ramlibacter sp. WS9]|uniref:PglL family O-oligosaccharyltransferase n=1 Tax=Ramlibacter sp. WS9 TaxID=1882741 RepID=UPI001E456737|nr:Wzy polymerase domain-containing protein [Ramlibacter sp. WS9]
MALVLAIQPPARLNPVLVLALALLAAWTAIRTGLSPESLALAAACLLILMAAGAAAGGSSRASFIDAMAFAWLLAAAVSTAMALCQYFGVEASFAPWINSSSAGEAYANLRQRNQFASLTAIGMASLLWLSPRKLGAWTAVLAMAWLAAGNAATTSRTGLMQMLVLGVLACAWPGPRRARAALFGVGLTAYLVAALALPALLEALTGVAGNRLWERVAAVDACSSRTVLWSNVLHLIAQHPWRGWGWGELDFAHFTTLHPGARFCDILDNAHSLPLHLAVELGVPAALIACVGLLWAALRARPWSDADPVRQMAWGVLAVIGLHSLLEYPLWYGPFQLAFGLCLGLLWGVKPGPPLRAAGARARMVSAGLAVTVVAACAYATWDYRRVSQVYLPPESRTPAMRDDPLPQIRKSWLFRNQARFAELTITPLTLNNAAWTYETARSLLHYSPEPRIIEKALESALVLKREDELLMDLARFKAAFPEAYDKWSKDRGGRGSAPPGQPAT